MTAPTYFTLTGSWVPDTNKGYISGTASIQMLVGSGDVLPTSLGGVIVPHLIPAKIVNGSLCDQTGRPGVSLVANTVDLNLSTALYYTVVFSLTYHPVSGLAQSIKVNPVTFTAPTSATTVDLGSVTPAAGVEAGQVVSVGSVNITDATTVGRALIVATDASTARTVIGAAGVPAAGMVKSTGTALTPAVSGTDYGTYSKPGSGIPSTDMASAVQTSLGLANTALQPSAVVNNTDGTVSVNSVNTLEPLSTVTIATTSAAPAIGQTTYYNATSGNLTPPLLALSGLRVGSRLAVRRDPADVSQNTVTLTCAGADTFYSSGTTSTTLPISGEQREYQVISVSGVKYWAPAGPLNPIAGLDARYGTVRRPLRNTIAAVGDSVTSRGGFALYQPAVGYSYLQQLQVLTHQRIRFGGGNFAVAGTGAVQAQSTQLPQVLAMKPLPGACVLGVGPTDMRQSVSSFATSFPILVSAVKSMVASLLNAGIVPIMLCVPPDQNTSVLPAAQYQLNIRQWNSWIRRYSALNGFPLIDAFTPLAAVDGTFLPGTDAGDATHPGPTGMRLIAQQALADGLPDIFPPNSLVNTARTTDDLTNLMNNGTVNYGLFTADSNSDGVADGYATIGTATYSLVTPATSDQLRGNWQQIVNTTGNHGSIYYLISPSFYSVGDVLAISARVQTSGVEASGGTWQACVVATTPGGYVTPDGTNNTFLYAGAIGWASDVQDGEIYSEFTVVSQMTSLTVEAGFNGSPTSGTATLRVGELTVRNLTRGGLLS